MLYHKGFQSKISLGNSEVLQLPNLSDDNMPYKLKGGIAQVYLPMNLSQVFVRRHAPLGKCYIRQ